MELRKIVGLLEVVRLAAEVNPEMTLQQLEVFLRATIEEGIGVKTMVQRTGQTQSSASRNLRMFCDRYTPTQDGLGFLEWVPDPRDFRAKGAYLTPKGKEFVESLCRVL